MLHWISSMEPFERPRESWWTLHEMISQETTSCTNYLEANFRGKNSSLLIVHELGTLSQLGPTRVERKYPDTLDNFNKNRKWCNTAFPELFIFKVNCVFCCSGSNYYRNFCESGKTSVSSSRTTPNNRCIVQNLCFIDEIILETIAFFFKLHVASFPKEHQ